MIEKSLFRNYIEHSGYGNVYLLGSAIDNAYSSIVNVSVNDFALALRNMEDPAPPPLGLLPRFPYHFPVPTCISSKDGFAALLDRLETNQLSPGAKHYLLCLYGRIGLGVRNGHEGIESKFLGVMKKGEIYQCDAFQVSLLAPCRDVGTPIFPRVVHNKNHDGSGLSSIHLFRDKFRLDASHVYTSTYTCRFDQAYLCPDLEAYQPTLEDAFFSQGVRTSTWLLALMEKERAWRWIAPQAAMFSIRYTDAEVDALLFNQLHSLERFFHPSLAISEILPKNMHLSLADYFNPSILDGHISTYQNLSTVLAYAMSPTNSYWMSLEWKKNLLDISDCALACGFGTSGEVNSVLSNIELNKKLKSAETTSMTAGVLVDACKSAIGTNPNHDPLGPLPFGTGYIDYSERGIFVRKGIESKYAISNLGGIYG